MIDKVAGWAAQISRATPAFFLLRGAVWVLATAALLVAGPADITLGPLAIWLVPVGLLPAALPRTAAVTLWIFAVLGGWLAATMVYDESISYLRLVLLATLLYTTHVLAAISAVIPFDAVVAPRTLLSWLPRTAALLGLTALLALVAAALPQLFGGARFLIASLVGFAVMAGLAYYLARLVNRA
jgi:hypothetical protein